MRVRVACFGNDSRCASSQLYARSTARGGNELGFDGARCNLMRTKLGASSYTLFLAQTKCEIRFRHRLFAIQFGGAPRPFCIGGGHAFECALDLRCKEEKGTRLCKAWREDMSRSALRARAPLHVAARATMPAPLPPEGALRSALREARCTHARARDAARPTSRESLRALLVPHPRPPPARCSLR